MSDDHDHDHNIVTPLRSNSTKRRLPLFSDDNSKSQKKIVMLTMMMDPPHMLNFIQRLLQSCSEKREEDHIPLPKNYKADVEIALKTTRMTVETRSSFFKVFVKKYPTRTDYI